MLWLALLGATASTAFAQVSAGDLEVNVAGSYARYSVEDADGDVDESSIEAKVAYYATPNVAAVVAVDYMRVGLLGESGDMIELSLGGDFLILPDKPVIPFVGASVVYGHAEALEEDYSEFGWEVRGGVRSFIAENIAISTTVSYTKVDIIERLTVAFGLSYFFKQK